MVTRVAVDAGGDDGDGRVDGSTTAAAARAPDGSSDDGEWSDSEEEGAEGGGEGEDAKRARTAS